MRYLKFIIILLVICYGCSGDKNGGGVVNQEGSINVSGTVGYPQSNGLILLEEFTGSDFVVKDTLTLDQNYTFNKNVQIDNPGYYRFNFYSLQQVNVILHKDDVNINVDGNSNQGFAQVSGSSDHDFIARVQQASQEFQQSPGVQRINQQFGEANQNGDEEKMNQLRQDYLELDARFKQSLVDMIDTMGASLGVVEILRSGGILDRDKHYDTYKNYAERLRNELPQSTVAQSFVAEVEQMKKLAIGQVAPEISLPNPDGEVVPLSSLRGKYVLVDFWAKWCRPCRMENPNVVRMYNRFNKDGFEVYGVSLDRNKRDWLQAIEQDGLHWTQVSDLKFWNSEAAKIYNIKAIPFGILVDPEGVIIGKNLRGPALERKLEEIFEQS
ncbi:MAG: TlpA disulfide reductase family protein [Bacteroidota bacterium]